MDKSIIKNKRGAVNSYRFVAMYIFISLILGMVSAFYYDKTAVKRGFNLAEEGRIQEIANDKNEIIEGSDELVKSNQYTLQSGWGDEAKLGRSWISSMGRGFIPGGMIPSGVEATETEIAINKIIFWFQIIIMMFATYEIFQMVVKSKTT